MVRSTRFSWDDLDPVDRPRLHSAFDDPDEDEWDLDDEESPPPRRVVRGRRPDPPVDK